MVNTNEWLIEKIPINQRSQATILCIYEHCQNSHSNYNSGCNYCKNRNQSNCSNAPSFKFYNIILEEELDLNDFVNLEQLIISGIVRQGQDQQQKLTSLKIDKCNKLTKLTINYTTLANLNVERNTMLQDINIDNNQFGFLSLGRKPKLNKFSFAGNINLSFTDFRLKGQVERLISVKSVSLNDLKLKIKEENLEYQLVVTKNILSKDEQIFLDLLLETQQEILKNSDNIFVRKQLEKVKERLLEVLTIEEIQDFIGQKVEINELEIQLNNLRIQENQNND